jgi:hypothetical protein
MWLVHRYLFPETFDHSDQCMFVGVRLGKFAQFIGKVRENARLGSRSELHFILCLLPLPTRTVRSRGRAFLPRC